MKTPDEIKQGLNCCKHGKCSECPYNDGSIFRNDCTTLLAADAIAYIKKMENHSGEATKMVASEPAPRWISVEDRLPECFKHVLVARNSAKGPIVEQGFRDVGDWWRVYGTRTKKVRFWMPLPEPPKGE